MFSDWSVDELKAAVKSLEKAYAAGVLSCTYAGQVTTFDNAGALRRRLAEMSKALSDKSGGARIPRKFRISTPSKGL
jgi:hypothetical protein